MACPPIITGEQFLQRTLSHIDCQAQLIGSYGYQALGQPGSSVSIAVTSLLALFIALIGVRFLFGPGPQPRDLLYDVLKIGLMLTLAFSWPAFRTLVYDVTLKGPAEIASTIQSGSANERGAGFADRLQAADNGLVQLTILGSGRNASGLVEGDGAGSTFRAAAIEDETGLGTARVLFLASTIGTLGLLRIAAGLLLALTPIATVLWFFTQSRGIFAGWAKGLVYSITASVGAVIVLSVQLAILEPWLSDAIQLRNLGYAVPAAPTELLAIMLAFTIVQLATLWLLAKVVFHRGWINLPEFSAIFPSVSATPRASNQAVQSSGAQRVIRAERISNSVESSIRRERLITGREGAQTLSTSLASAQSVTGPLSEPQRLGNSYRRSNLRATRTAMRRDNSK